MTDQTENAAARAQKAERAEQGHDVDGADVGLTAAEQKALVTVFAGVIYVRDREELFRRVERIVEARVAAAVAAERETGCNCTAALIERATAAEAEVERLREQVSAVRALADEWERPVPKVGGTPEDAAYALRAALDAAMMLADRAHKAAAPTYTEREEDDK